jgi:hypothetical protein
MQQPRTLSLVWRRNILEMVLEAYFIREVLLGQIGRPLRTVVIESNAPMPYLDDALYVSFGPELAGHLRAARARGVKNIGVLHMADEHGDHDRGFYGDAGYVLRNYWFKHALVPPNPQSLGVMWVPNGYANGFGPINAQNLPGTAERKIMGFFSGALSGRTLLQERQDMVQTIQQAKLPFLVGATPGFAMGLKPITYAAFLCSTRFGLVPGGNSPETIRLYEVLEAGAIPIMLKSAVVTAPDGFNNPPFLLLDRWADLPAAYAPYADADAPRVIDVIEEKRLAVLDWWIGFKELQQKRIKDLIDRSFERAHGHK